MILFGDYHTHTRIGKGKKSILDYALVAKAKGLKEFATTDHGFAFFAGNLKSKELIKIKKEIEYAKEQTGINILLGVEANIISQKGELDIEKNKKDFDIILAGFHLTSKPKSLNDFFNFYIPTCSPFAPSKQRLQKNTDAILWALDKNEIDVLVHLGYSLNVYPLMIAREAKNCGTLIELNGRRINFTDEQILEMEADKVKFILNSDAHCARNIGECNRAVNLALKLNIDKSLLTNIDKLPQFKKLKRVN